MTTTNVATQGDALHPYVFNFMCAGGHSEPRFVTESQYPQYRSLCYQKFLIAGENSVIIYRDGCKIDTLRKAQDHHYGGSVKDAFVRKEPDHKEWLVSTMAKCNTGRAERGRKLIRDVVIPNQGWDKATMTVKANVPSSNGGKYTVTVVLGVSHHCTCEDCLEEGPGHICKHQYAVLSRLASSWPTVPTVGHCRMLESIQDRAELEVAHPEEFVRTSDPKLHGGKSGFLAR